jgi:integrase
MAFPPFLGNSSVHFSRTGGSYCRISQLPSCGASWSFVENLKRYAREAGIGKIHLHQTRHTFARMVARRSGSLSETQDALGHRHASTTRIYVESIAVKTDKYSQHILEALELPDFETDLD